MEYLHRKREKHGEGRRPCELVVDDCVSWCLVVEDHELACGGLGSGCLTTSL